MKSRSKPQGRDPVLRLPGPPKGARPIPPPSPRPIPDEEFVVSVFVPGKPEVSGNLKIGFRYVGGQKRAYNHWSNAAKLTAWKGAIATAMRAGAPSGLYEGPVSANLIFHLPMPVAMRRRWAKGLLKYLWRSKRPDLDKLIRTVFNGVVESGLIKDVPPFVHLVAAKVHGAQEGGEGVRIRLISALALRSD